MDSLNRYMDFENFIYSLVQDTIYSVTRNLRFKNEKITYEIDLIIEYKNICYLIETKSLRSNNYPISSLNQAILHLRAVSIAYQKEFPTKKIKEVLISSNNIPQLYPSNIKNSKIDFSIEILDRNKILFLIKDNNQRLKEFQKFIDSSFLDEYYLLESVLSDNNDDFFSLLKSSIQTPNIIHSPIDSDLGVQLLQLKTGRENFSNYENHVKKILEYLFDSNLDNPKKQVRSSDSINRYDLICRIKFENSGFWKFLQDRLNCQYVVFECKNYSKKITQGEILTTEKYLLPLALRSVSIIFSRKGANSNAKKFAEGALRENGKLILILDDKIVCEMINRKNNGDDPSDLLFDLADNFFMSLNR